MCSKNKQLKNNLTLTGEDRVTHLISTQSSLSISAGLDLT